MFWWKDKDIKWDSVGRELDLLQNDLGNIYVWPEKYLSRRKVNLKKKNPTRFWTRSSSEHGFCPEPRCGVALVSDARTGPPDLERGSPSCPPPTNDNPSTDRGGADSETESDPDDPWVKHIFKNVFFRRWGFTCIIIFYFLFFLFLLWVVFLNYLFTKRNGTRSNSPSGTRNCKLTGNWELNRKLWKAKWWH